MVYMMDLGNASNISTNESHITYMSIPSNLRFKSQSVPFSRLQDVQIF